LVSNHVNKIIAFKDVDDLRHLVHFHFMCAIAIPLASSIVQSLARSFAQPFFFFAAPKRFSADRFSQRSLHLIATLKSTNGNTLFVTN
jgi:hypothetical protein